MRHANKVRRIREPWFTQESIREGTKDFVRVLFWFGVLLNAYVFSSGPALWLAEHGGLIVGLVLYIIYQPLISYAQDHPTAGAALKWYLSWWGDTGLIL